jgi:hypothetical protein
MVSPSNHEGPRSHPDVKRIDWRGSRAAGSIAAMKHAILPALTAALWLAAALPASAGQPVATATAANPVVVELFTSQGCNSCPPADRLLGELAQRDDVLPLSMHVTYWDRLGWTDPFGLAEVTDRQRAYAGSLGGRGRPYTPQMVIDGVHDIVGSRRDQVLATIDDAAAGAAKLAIGFSRDGSALSAVLPQASLSEPAIVWLVLFDREHSTAVARGENGGRQLTNYNVVRVFRPVGTWDGTAREVALGLGPEALGHDGCAVIVQQGAVGPILGAAAIDLKAALGS